MTSTAARDLEEFQAHRGELLGLAYRMLGEHTRAEDMVQEAWLKWSGRTGEAENPRAYLIAPLTRLCLNELDSARRRREESRSQLPEPVDLETGPLGRVEATDDISMAFLVMLQRLTPAERAVLLLHDVFDFSHGEIAVFVERSEASCRKLLERAHANVASEKRMLAASREEHARLLSAFVGAASRGDMAELVSLLAEDAVLMSDAGPTTRTFAGVRALGAPLEGPNAIAKFLARATRRSRGMLVPELRELNGRPAVVFRHEGKAVAALLLGVADGKVRKIFFQADPDRLGLMRL